MKILQITDTHLTGDCRPLFGSSPAQRLAAAAEAIRRDHGDAAFCLFTGDLADDGSAQAYRQLAEVAATLPMPCHFLVGNHDARPALLDALWPAGEHAGGFAQRAIETEHGLFLLLDTQRDRAAGGAYCQRRLDWLAGQLRQAGPQEGFWLVMHHPPLPLGIPSMDQYALDAAAADSLWQVIEPYRERIRHLLFGHVHRAIGGAWRGIPFSCAKSTNHQVALDLRSRGVDVPGGHDAPGFAVILIDRDSVVVHHQEFLATGPAFWI